MKALNLLLIPGALLLGTVISHPTIAQVAPANPASLAVSHADLDLGNPADRIRLQRRLRAAAREVCGTAYNFDLRGRNAVRECRARTLESVRLPRSDALASVE
ncbi:UrcA family protein [Parasphingopyxis algicola]|uniref:UrcA family protein n=1 Tax=Parasphingopyxis algicola TaxID=2026624 RepID=UPI0015A27327|nr:UrcA family protein [Parasphingopyxis algicola]QLC25659.1 UrcA family protein [Parasphingopyxis algicola]